MIRNIPPLLKIEEAGATLENVIMISLKLKPLHNVN